MKIPNLCYKHIMSTEMVESRLGHAPAPRPAAAALPGWPVFGLRLHTPRLELRVPTDGDLHALAALARRGVHLPGETPFVNDWTSLPSPAFERRFLQYFWGIRAEWGGERWRLPFGAFTADGEPVGIQQIEATGFAVRRTVRSGTWVGLALQRNGYGTEMREAVLDLAFRHLGALWAEAGTNETNAGARRMLERLGYGWNGLGVTGGGPGGTRQPVVNFRLSAEDWLLVERPHLHVERVPGDLEPFAAA